MASEQSLAMMRGEALVRERGFTLPVDPFALAKEEDIQVVAKPTTGGVSGLFMRIGDSFGIAYAAHLDNEGFQRFSVGHELGHYFLPGHPEHVLELGDIHESRAGFTSKDPRELEADQFAVGLLLPREQFVQKMKRVGEGLRAIEELADLCCTSLTATAIRFTECSREPVAVVVSNQLCVEFCAMSKSFKELPHLTWLRSTCAIPRGTVTGSFVGNPGRIVHAERSEGVSSFHEWFGSGPDAKLFEEVVGLGRYGKVLTVLTPEELMDADEQEEEDALLASWTPTFSRPRRR